MNLQHVNVKIFAEQPAAIHLPDTIPVFHRWIQNRVTEENLIDVADYGHVLNGPGVVLIAHEAIFGLDLRDGRLGLLYNRRAALEGSDEEKIEQAYNAAWRACRRLEQEPEFHGKLKFRPGDFEVFVNDRLIAPNNPETFFAIRPGIDAFLTRSFGAGRYEVRHTGEPRQLFRVSVSAAV